MCRAELKRLTEDLLDSAQHLDFKRPSRTFKYSYTTSSYNKL